MAQRKKPLAREKRPRSPDPPEPINMTYGAIRTLQLEGRYPEGRDEGAWLISVNRVNYGWGNVTVKDWPSETGSINLFAPMPAGIDQRAKKMRLHHYQRINSLENARKSLDSNRPWTVSLPITPAWFDAPTGRIPLPRSSSEFQGVHCVLIGDYSDSQRALRFANS